MYFNFESKTHLEVLELTHNTFLSNSEEPLECLILFLVKGKLEIDNAEGKTTMNKNSCLISNKTQAIDFRSDEKILGYAALFSSQFLSNQIELKSSRVFTDLFIQNQYTIVKIDQSEVSSFKEIWRLLLDAFTTNKRFFHIEIIYHIFNLLYCYIAEAYLSNKSHPSLRLSQSKTKLVIDFYRELEGNFTEYREIKFYAEKLFVSKVHLSRTIKEITGKTVRQIINENILWEAKKLLEAKLMNISEIAEKLNFSSVSSFSIFFKRQCGLNPSEFRRKIK